MEQKNNYFYPDEQEIPDGEVVKYYEHQRKLAYSNIQRENKLRKKRMADKLKEQEQQQKEKEIQLMEEEAQAQQVSKKKIHRDRILNVMYRNPEVFKVNTIVQTIARLKKGSMDQGDAGEDVQRVPSKATVTETECKQVAMNTILRTMESLKPPQTESSARWSHGREEVKRKRSQIWDGLQSQTNLAESTKGIHFQKVRSRRVMGGIFAVIKLKKQIDEFEKLQANQRDQRAQRAQSKQPSEES